MIALNDLARHHAPQRAELDAAIELALRALGIGAGDEVITVANAGMYATTAIRAAGVLPAAPGRSDSARSGLGDAAGSESLARGISAPAAA